MMINAYWERCDKQPETQYPGEKIIAYRCVESTIEGASGRVYPHLEKLPFTAAALARRALAGSDIPAWVSIREREGE